MSNKRQHLRASGLVAAIVSLASLALLIAPVSAGSEQRLGSGETVELRGQGFQKVYLNVSVRPTNMPERPTPDDRFRFTVRCYDGQSRTLTWPDDISDKPVYLFLVQTISDEGCSAEAVPSPGWVCSGSSRYENGKLTLGFFCEIPGSPTIPITVPEPSTTTSFPKPKPDPFPLPTARTQNL